MKGLLVGASALVIALTGAGTAQAQAAADAPSAAPQNPASQTVVNDPSRTNAQVDAPTPGAIAAPPSRTAEQQNASGLGDIVVTAQRQSESLQHAAVAVSAVTGDALRAANVTQPSQLTALVPALQVTPSAGPYSLFYLRGVGNFNGNALSDPAVAFNFDGVYIGRPSSTTGFFYDIDRVEVLKGPQGTLYGRNATGGAINVISHRADLHDFEADVVGEYGNYNEVRIDGAVNLPIGENAAMRVAGIYADHNPYMKDGTDDEHDYGGRVTFRYDPTNTLKINLVADYFHQGGAGAGSDPSTLNVDNRDGFLSAAGQAAYTSQANVLNGRNFATVPGSVRPYQDNNYWGVTGTVDWTTPAGTITVTPAYREGHLNYLSFVPGFYISQRERDSQTSIETRLASDNDRPIRYLVGSFYYHETISDPTVVYLHQSNGSYQNLYTTTASFATFGRLTWAVTPSIRLSAGGRYTAEKKTFSGNLVAISRVCTAPSTYFPAYVPGCPNAAIIPYSNTPPSAPDFSQLFTTGVITVPPTVINNSGANSRRASFDRPTYRLAADWDITPQNLLYASYETGFKSGGFFFSDDSGVYRPESIQAWTVGSKNRFIDNRLQLNLEAFYWRYKDQQISHLGYDSLGVAIFPTENVGRATFKGIEAETQLLVTRNTLLTADVQYLDARYDNFIYTTPNNNGGFNNGTGCPNVGTPGTSYTVNCSGQRPPNAPEWTLNVGAQQTLPLDNGGKFVLSAHGHHQTDTLTGLEFLPVEVQAGYWTGDASLTYSAPRDRFFLTGFVNNLSNATIIGQSASPAFVANSTFKAYVLRPPRTYGVRAGVRF